MSTSTAEIVSARRVRGQATVSVVGKLDRAGLARLRAELAGWRAAVAPVVRLEISEMDGYEVNLAPMLAWAQIQLRARGGELILIGADPWLPTQLREARAALQAVPEQH